VTTADQVIAVAIFLIPAAFLLLLPHEERARRAKGRSVFALGWNTRLGWAFAAVAALFFGWLVFRA
jgi:hypothetical protein